MLSNDLQRHDTSSQLELFLSALKVDGDGSAKDSRIIQAIRDGESQRSVLAMASRISKGKKGATSSD